MNMSHQLRTPMNTILGFSEYLLDQENLTEEMVENDAKNIDGKFKIGSAIPFIIPNIDNDEAVEEPYLLSASGISKSSIVLRPVCI